MSARLFDLPDKNGRYPFTYRNSASTNVGETFRREWERLGALARRLELDQASASSPPSRPVRPA